MRESFGSCWCAICVSAIISPFVYDGGGNSIILNMIKYMDKHNHKTNRKKALAHYRDC